MKLSRSALVALAAIALTTLVSACSDTWHGARQDTGDNMNSAGSAIDHAGNKVKP